MWNLTYDTDKSIYEEKQTHRYKTNHGCQRGGLEGGMEGGWG